MGSGRSAHPSLSVQRLADVPTNMKKQLDKPRNYLHGLYGRKHRFIGQQQLEATRYLRSLNGSHSHCRVIEILRFYLYEYFLWNTIQPSYVKLKLFNF